MDVGEHSVPDLCHRPKSAFSATRSPGLATKEDDLKSASSKLDDSVNSIPHSAISLSLSTESRTTLAAPEDALIPVGNSNVTHSLHRLRGAYDRAVLALEGSLDGDEASRDITSIATQPLQGQVSALSRDVSQLQHDLAMLSKQVDALRLSSRQAPTQSDFSSKESMALTQQMTDLHGRVNKKVEMQGKTIMQVMSDAANLQAAVKQEEATTREQIEGFSIGLLAEVEKREAFAGELYDVALDVTRLREEIWQSSQHPTKNAPFVDRLDGLSTITSELQQHRLVDVQKHEEIAGELSSNLAKHTELQESLLASLKVVDDVTKMCHNLECSVADQAAEQRLSSEADQEAHQEIARRTLEQMSCEEAELHQGLATLRQELHQEAKMRMELAEQFHADLGHRAIDSRRMVGDDSSLQSLQLEASKENAAEHALSVDYARSMETFRHELKCMGLQCELWQEGLQSVFSEKALQIDGLSKNVQHLLEFEQEIRQNAAAPKCEVQVGDPQKKREVQCEDPHKKARPMLRSEEERAQTQVMRQRSVPMPSGSPPMPSGSTNATPTQTIRELRSLLDSPAGVATRSPGSLIPRSPRATLGAMSRPATVSER